MAIVTHTFLDKTNTIIKNNKINVGMNPIMELCYGVNTTRGLIHFDVKKLQELHQDKTYGDLNKLHHVLKMRNTGTVDFNYQNKNKIYNDSMRASSFELILFKINKKWDGGDGYDYTWDWTHTIGGKLSNNGSNWFNSTTVNSWDKPGIYTIDELYENDLIIGKQHFDLGNEDLEVDITDYVNKLITNSEENYGIGIAFAREYEEFDTHEIYNVSFFTDHTHTIYRPYIETRYDEYINDDRSNFYLDKDNRLYFYALVGNTYVNLDELPVCSLNDSELAVYQASKGVYYVKVNYNSERYDYETMHYDVWSNIKYKGKTFPDRELYFTTKQSDNYFTFGIPYETKPKDKIIPSIAGINHKSSIHVGDVIKVNVFTKIAYTTKQNGYVDGLYYKLYSKSDTSEIPIIEWTPVEKGYNENYFFVDTNSLPVGKYFIAIKIEQGISETIHRELCEFNIINNSIDLIN